MRLTGIGSGRITSEASSTTRTSRLSPVALQRTEHRWLLQSVRVSVFVTFTLQLTSRTRWSLRELPKTLVSWVGSLAEVSLHHAATYCMHVLTLIGHGPLSSTYGLGVDNVLEIKIVTPDGDLRTANPCLNPDLFWALRGGGGGTFGVITSVTMRAHPEPRASTFTFKMTSRNSNNVTGFWDIAATVLSEFPRLKEAGLQGYSQFTPPGIEGVKAWTWTFDMYAYDKPKETVEAIFAPVAKKLQPENGTTISYSSEVVEYPNFSEAWNATVVFEPVGYSSGVVASRLLPAAALTQETNRTARVLQDLGKPVEGTGGGILRPYLVANSNAKMIEETSATPAWRDTVVHFIITDLFPDSYSIEEGKVYFERMQNEKVVALEGLARGSGGSYLNEVCPVLPMPFECWLILGRLIRTIRIGKLRFGESIIPDWTRSRSRTTLIRCCGASVVWAAIVGRKRVTDSCASCPRWSVSCRQ